jgi:hypothetical protein
MGTVILLNLANYAHWIAFPAVAKKAAAYYDVTGTETLKIQPRIILFLGPRVVNVYFCFISTYFCCIPTYFCLISTCFASYPPIFASYPPIFASYPPIFASLIR